MQEGRWRVGAWRVGGIQRHNKEGDAGSRSPEPLTPHLPSPPLQVFELGGPHVEAQLAHNLMRLIAEQVGGSVQGEDMGFRVQRGGMRELSYRAGCGSEPEPPLPYLQDSDLHRSAPPPSPRLTSATFTQRRLPPPTGYRPSPQCRRCLRQTAGEAQAAGAAARGVCVCVLGGGG